MSNLCVVVSSNNTTKVRRHLEKLNLNDPSRRLKSLKNDNSVAIPIQLVADNSPSGSAGEESPEESIAETLHKYLDKSIKFEIRKLSVPSAKKYGIKKPERLLKEQLKSLLEKKGHLWTEDLLHDVPSHWERHGDLVLVPSSAFSSHLWQDIGDEVWEITTKCLACKRLAQKTVVSTDGYRTPQVRLLFGDSRWVEHVDNGIRYTYDITRCMFSAGNVSEKLRVARFDCTDEVVVDLYAGIGYFTLPYLVFTGLKHLHACEWNPAAVEALHKNLVLNKVHDRCTVHKGDNREVCPTGVADRVNLGLIPSSRDGWPVACAALKPTCGGLLHIHYNVNTKPGENTRNLDHTKHLPVETFRQEATCPSQNIVQDNIQTFSRCTESSLRENSDNHLYTLPGDKHGDNYDSVLNMTAELQQTTVSQPVTKCQTTVENVQDVTKHDKTLHSGIKSKWMSWAHEVSMEIRIILNNLHNKEWTTKIVHIEHVKSYAPYIDHLVLDLECKPA